MLYKNLRNGSLFLSPEGTQVCRKHSDAFAVVVVGHNAGRDAIFALKDHVTPVSPQTVSDATGISRRYL